MRAAALAPPVDRACRTAVLAALARLDSGRIVVREPGRVERRFGPGTPDVYGRDALDATVIVHDPRTYRAVLGGASAGLGQAFSDGWWDCDDLTALLRLLSRSARRVDRLGVTASRTVGWVTDAARSFRRPDIERDRANVASHYDLGNELFSAFLDPSMTYSSAWFDDPEEPLLDASINKLDRLCCGLQLRPTDHVLEIGTGWGSFAIHAARRYGCRVTTTTLSRQQFELASDRVARAGVADRVDVRNEHYRDVDGTFDKLASIEMIEAVDWRELDAFFRTCTDRLAPDGLMGLQAIVVPGARWRLVKDRRDFVKTYIFPGGCLPSVESISRSLARVSDLSMVSLDDFGLHYAETLRRWRANFTANRGDVAALGYDERFARRWEFYLSYCEAGFDEREVSVVQSILARPGHRPSVPWEPAVERAPAARVLPDDEGLAVREPQGWEGAGGASASSKASSSM